MCVRLGIKRLQVQHPLDWLHSFMEIDREIFSMVILSSVNSRRAVVSFWGKNVQNTG